MKRLKLLFPLAYFKSTVVCIDDDSSFLDTQKTHFKAKKLNAEVQSFSNPDKALNWIKTNNTDLASTCLNFKESYTGSRNFDLVNRFKDLSLSQCVSLVIVDYAMPPKNGISFSEELREIAPDIKILMLTGEADETLAVNAFNNGIIDGFVKKENFNLGKTIVETANKMILDYFTQQTNIIVGNINPDNASGLPYFFKETSSQQHFREQLDLLNLTNFTLLNERGWFKASYKNETSNYLTFMTEDEYHNELEYLSEYYDEDSAELKSAANYQSIPIVLDIEDDETLLGKVSVTQLNEKKFLFILAKKQK